MTVIRPNLFKLVAPLAAFALAVALLVALAGPREIALPERSSQSYESLGYGYLQQARATGDPRSYARAERSFDAALRQDPGDVDALLGAATLAGFRHDFREQLRLGLDAHRLMPETVAAYPEIADARVELGRYRAAERTLQRMLDLKPNLASYARVSYYRELHGDLDGAIEAMRLAVSAGGAPENVAYVQTLLGDLELQRGRTRAARLAYTSALRSLPGYPAGMVGLARVDAAGSDLRRAAARLRRAAKRQPSTAALVLLADVEQRLARPAAAEDALAAARAHQRLDRQAGAAPDAEAVIFEADHGSPARAVPLGRQVWQAAPSVRSADALGWALTSAGRPREGYAYSLRALRLGSRDASFRLHAAVAATRAGLGKAAARHLAVAASGRTALSPAARALLEELRR